MQNDLWAIYPPAHILWTTNADLDFFTDVYDWDTLDLSGSASQLSISVQLCSSLFPCRISIEGREDTYLLRYGSGSLLCQVQIGCSGIQVTALEPSNKDG